MNAHPQNGPLWRPVKRCAAEERLWFPVAVHPSAGAVDRNGAPTAGQWVVRRRPCRRLCCCSSLRRPRPPGPRHRRGPRRPRFRTGPVRRSTSPSPACSATDRSCTGPDLRHSTRAIRRLRPPRLPRRSLPRPSWRTYSSDPARHSACSAWRPWPAAASTAAGVDGTLPRPLRGPQRTFWTPAGRWALATSVARSAAAGFRSARRPAFGVAERARHPASVRRVCRLPGARASPQPPSGRCPCAGRPTTSASCDAGRHRSCRRCQRHATRCVPTYFGVWKHGAPRAAAALREHGRRDALHPEPETQGAADRRGQGAARYVPLSRRWLDAARLAERTLRRVFPRQRPPNRPQRPATTGQRLHISLVRSLFRGLVAQNPATLADAACRRQLVE